jgi:hypothetical protein
LVRIAHWLAHALQLLQAKRSIIYLSKGSVITLGYKLVAKVDRQPDRVS